MPRPTMEQIKKYVKLLKPIFKERGIVMTDAKINKMVEDSMTKDVKRAQRIEKLDELQLKAKNKYTLKLPANTKSYNMFERIFYTMIRPEMTKKDVDYNKQLLELSNTPEGQRKIIKSAADMVLGLSKDSIYGDPCDVMAEYEKNYTAMQLGFISNDISLALESVDKDTSLSAEEKALVLPDGFRARFDKEHLLYQDAGRIQAIVTVMSNPLYGLIPRDIPYTEVISNVTTHVYETPSLKLTPDEMMFLNQFLGASIVAEENRSVLDKASKEYYAPRFEKANQKMGMFKDKYPQCKVYDKDGNEVPSTRDIRFGDRYNFVKENGDVLGARVNGQVKFARTNEIFPKVAAIGKAIKDEKFKTLGIFDQHWKNLKKAKTIFNSDEYTDLIKMVEFVNKNDKFKPELDLAKDQEYALKLIALKKQINKYLVHKAKDGVNDKAYGKLAAVEALNKDISERLGKLKMAPFKYEGKRFVIKNIPLTYEQECKKLSEVHKDKQVIAPDNISDKYLTNFINYQLKQDFPDKNFDAATIKNVDDCMNRIIMHASVNDVSDQRYADHLNIKNKFRNTPLAEATIKEPQIGFDHLVAGLGV